MTMIIRTSIGRSKLMAVPALALLTGCVNGNQNQPTFVQAIAQEPPTIEAKIEPGSLPASNWTIKRIDDGSDEETADGLAAIEEARKEALIDSAPEGFLNATQYFPYEDGALYQLHAASGFISMIQLQPGEILVNYAAGDTARWIIGDVARGDQTMLLVKPTRANLSTNLVISTDKRVYLIEATSHKGDAYNASIAWTYPFDDLAQQVAVIEAENQRHDETVVIGVPIDQLDFDYEIDGDKPSWRPVRAFSDGSKTYIEFPKTLGNAEAPPLFLSDDDGTGQLVNYRVKQNYYIVDRLFDWAELRLDSIVVAIKRAGSSGWSSWFGNVAVTSPKDRRRCKLCRDPDDHGDNDRNHHDADDHHGMSR